MDEYIPLPMRLAKESGLLLRNVLAMLRIDHVVWMKINKGIINDVPDSFKERLMLTFDCPYNELQIFFEYGPAKIRDSAPFANVNPDTHYPTQSWKEAITTSNMGEEDKQYWLDVSRESETK